MSGKSCECGTAVERQDPKDKHIAKVGTPSAYVMSDHRPHQALLAISPFIGAGIK